MKFLIKATLFGFMLCGLFLSEQVIATKISKGTILITGANRGIGLALTSKFKNEGYTVIATARKPTESTALSKLGVRIEQLDVTSPASIKHMVDRLGNIKIDILLNNAGVGGNGSKDFQKLDIERIAKTFNVNSIGPVRMTQALFPHLKRGNKKIVVNISSSMGSITNNINGRGMGYRASKTALNSFMKSLSLRLAKDGFTFVSLHPGWVVTDMTNKRGRFTTTESAANLFQVITKLTLEDNGKFYDYKGEVLAW